MSLDKDSFPHIFTAILEAADHSALLRLRATCREVRATVDALLATHLIWDGDTLISHRTHTPLSPASSILAGLLSPPPLSLVNTLVTNTTVLDIRPDAFVEGGSPSLVIKAPLRAMRVWPAADDTFALLSPQLHARADTLVFCKPPKPRAFCGTLPFDMVTSLEACRPARLIIHLAGNSRALSGYVDSIMQSNVVVLVMDSSNVSDNLYLAQLCFLIKVLSRCEAHPPTAAFTMVNFEHASPISSSVFSRLTGHVQFRGDWTAQELLLSSVQQDNIQVNMRFVTLAEYEAELGKEQFTFEMGL